MFTMGVGVGGQAGTVGSGQLEVHQTRGQPSSMAMADNDTVKVARVGGSDAGWEWGTTLGAGGQ